MNFIKKILFVVFVILILVTSIIYCTLADVTNKHDRIKYNVSGVIKDTSGEDLRMVYIKYSSPKIITKTDSLGNYSIHKQNVLFLEFEKEGYQNIITKINDYSDLGNYEFKPFELIKSTDSSFIYRDLIYDKEKVIPNQINFTGQIKDVFGRTIEDVTVTLTDHKNTDVAFGGTFEFNKQSYLLNFEKKGYEKLSFFIHEEIDNSHNKNDIVLVKKREKKGVYLVQKDKLLALPRINLKYHSEKKYNSILWGGRYGYNVNTFYFPRNKNKFKIGNKGETLRFIVFNESYKYLFPVDDNLEVPICISDHKYSYSSYPTGPDLKDKVIIYPNKNNRSDTNYTIIDFIDNSDVEKQYTFVSSKTKKGYYFSY